MALSAWHSQHVWVSLPKADHFILHSAAASIKEKSQNTFLSSSPSNPAWFPYLFFGLFYIVLAASSVHLIKMHIFKSFFKAMLFGLRAAAGNYSQSSEEEIWDPQVSDAGSRFSPGAESGTVWKQSAAGFWMPVCSHLSRHHQEKHICKANRALLCISRKCERPGKPLTITLAMFVCLFADNHLICNYKLEEDKMAPLCVRLCWQPVLGGSQSDWLDSGVPLTVTDSPTDPTGPNGDWRCNTTPVTQEMSEAISAGLGRHAQQNKSQWNRRVLSCLGGISM